MLCFVSLTTLISILDPPNACLPSQIHLGKAHEVDGLGIIMTIVEEVG